MNILPHIQTLPPPLKAILLALFLFTITFFTYQNSLHNDFLMDDDGLILSGDTGHSLRDLTIHFLPDKYRLSKVEDSGSDSYYRPLAHIVPLAEFIFFRNDPFGYHLVSLILFWLCGLGIYYFVKKIWRDPAVGLLSALLFLVHPINGLFINYITAVVFAVQILAMLGAGLAFQKIIEGKNRLLFYPLGLLGYLTAIFCHETAFFLPLYLFTIACFPNRKKFVESFKLCLPFFVVGAAIFISRFFFASIKSNLLDKFQLFAMGPLEYLASWTRVMTWFLSRLVMPDGIVIIWATPVIRENIWLWIFLLTAGIALIILALRQRDADPLTAWGISWLAIGAIPTTLGCLFQPAVGVMFEPHWMFFPLIGLFTILAGILIRLARRLPKTGKILISIYVLTLMFISINMNARWGDERRYCRYWLDNVAADFKSIKFYLANAHLKKKEYAEAKKYYLEARENQWQDWQIYNNLAMIAMLEKKFAESDQYFQQALVFSPNSAVIWNNRGTLFLDRDDPDRAREYFLKAVALNHFYLEPRLNLAMLHIKKGDYASAIELCRENLRYDPQNRPTLTILLTLYLQTNDRAAAQQLGERILSQSRDSALLASSGSAFAAQNNIKLAAALLRRAIQLDKRNAAAYRELGKIYGNFNEFEQAIKLWQKGAQMDPGDPAFAQLISQAEALAEPRNGGR